MKLGELLEWLVDAEREYGDEIEVILEPSDDLGSYRSVTRVVVAMGKEEEGPPVLYLVEEVH